MIRIWIWLFSVSLLFVLGLFLLYRNDAENLRRAVEVEAFLRGFCEAEGRYPTVAEFQTRYGGLLDEDWYHWPADDLAGATFQYPMTLPLDGAPGDYKLSEFVPIISAYAVRNPCSPSKEDA